MGYDQENDFDFDFDTQQQHSHHSYKQYQRKVTKKKNESMAIFVSAFFIMLFVFLGLAKQLSPDIDVSIGNQDLTKGISIVFVIIGAIIGFFAPIITLIGLLLFFELIREANNRNNPRKGTFV